jgi:hypothetical protein
MKHEVIVYHSPAEAAIWDFVTSATGSHLVLWLVCASIVVIASNFPPVLNLHRLSPRWLFNRWTLLLGAIMVTHTLYLGAKWLLTHL